MPKSEVPDKIKEVPEPTRAISSPRVPIGDLVHRADAGQIADEDWPDVIDALESGYSFDLAAMAGGVSAQTLSRILDNDVDKHSLCKKARFKGFQSLLGTIRRADKGWQGPAWMLERMHPERFALKQDFRVGSQVNVQVNVTRNECKEIATSFRRWTGQDSVNEVQKSQKPQ